MLRSLQPETSRPADRIIINVCVTRVALSLIKATRSFFFLLEVVILAFLESYILQYMFDGLLALLLRGAPG